MKRGKRARKVAACMNQGLPEIKEGAIVYGAWVAGGRDSDLMLNYWRNPEEEPQAMLRVKDTGKGKTWYRLGTTGSLEENLAKFDEVIDRLLVDFCGEGATSQRIRNLTCDELLSWYSFGQNSEHDFWRAEFSALPRNPIGSWLPELVSESEKELKTVTRRQRFKTRAFLDTAKDHPRVSAFLAVDDDSRVRNLRVDHLVAVVDKSELDCQVFCMSRFEDGMVEAQPGPEASRFGLFSGTQVGCKDGSLGGTDLGEIPRIYSLIPGSCSQHSLPHYLCLKETNCPYGESEQDGKQGNSDHESPDREAESALTGSFNHEYSRIAPGKENRVN